MIIMIVLQSNLKNSVLNNLKPKKMQKRGWEILGLLQALAVTEMKVKRE